MITRARTARRIAVVLALGATLVVSACARLRDPTRPDGSADARDAPATETAIDAPATDTIDAPAMDTATDAGSRPDVDTADAQDARTDAVTTADADAASGDADVTPDSGDAARDGSPDPTALIYDDFEDSLLTGLWVDGTRSGRWIIDNIDASSWSETRGIMTSGPGDSCLSFVDRTACPANQGPALIHSEAPVDIMDGRFTVDVDMFNQTRGTGRFKSWLALVYTPETWDGTRGLLLAPTYLAAVVFEAPLFFELYWQGTRLVHQDAALTLADWHHIHLEMCGAAGYLIEVSRGGTVLATQRATTAVRPAISATTLRVQLGAEGPNKAFDNLVVRRGCERF